MAEKKEKPWLEEARRLREQGMSYEKIGESLGQNRSNIYRALNPEYRANEYARNRDKMLADSKERYYANREERKAKQRKYESEHRAEAIERSRKWQKENPERYKELLKRWAIDHNDKVLEHAKKYRETHREEVRKRISEWGKAHPDKRKASTAIRRARAAILPEDREDVNQIFKDAHQKELVYCYLCGELIPMGDRHVEHVLPLSRGGKTIPDNLKIAHSNCNWRKHRKTPDELPADFFSDVGEGISAPANE